MSITIVIILFLILVAEFTNGMTDAANAIATVVSTRVLTPIQAAGMAAVLNILGALVTGTMVATTIGKGIVKPEVIGLYTICAAVLTIIVWTTLAWKFGLPTSETHEMLAGLAGAGLATAGPSVLLWEGWSKVLIGLVLSTFFGFFCGLIIVSIIYWIFNRTHRKKVTLAFSRLQILSAAIMAFSHGSNDGQKFMGLFSLTLLLGGILPEFQVPVWVILLCGVVMGIGTITGGWRIIKTMGFKITHLQPIQGFAAESAASLSILIASFFGIPLSTTHTIGSAIAGVGSAHRLSAVRWSTTGQIVLTWILTFPACFVLGFIFALLLKPLF